METSQNTALEAATFRRLLEHLQKHTEVQNIDLMILADFCRNCLAKWYVAAGKEQGLSIDYTEAQQIIYGMPYSEWKKQFQTEASEEKLAAMAAIAKRKEEEGY